MADGSPRSHLLTLAPACSPCSVAPFPLRQASGLLLILAAVWFLSVTLRKLRSTPRPHTSPAFQTAKYLAWQGDAPLKCAPRPPAKSANGRLSSLLEIANPCSPKPSPGFASLRSSAALASPGASLVSLYAPIKQSKPPRFLGSPHLAFKDQTLPRLRTAGGCPRPAFTPLADVRSTSAPPFS